MIRGRTLTRDEVEKVWTIDRREVIDAVYYLENGVLILKQEHYDMQSWPRDEAERYTPVLEACYDLGGWSYGLFDDDQLAGVVVLESHFIGKQRDQLQLKFLHLSHPYRNQGWGKHLFELAKEEARRRGAKRLYISATPSEHTVGFYLRLGCEVTQEPDVELFALEPEDIHLECELE